MSAHDRLTGSYDGLQRHRRLRRLAEYFNADIILVRFLWLLAAILTFPLGIIAYIMAWIIMPEAPEVTAPSTAVAVNNR